MNTTDLFNFPFVDRISEQNRLNNFLENPVQNTLWIRGDHGLGKTEFLKYVFNERNDYKLCYIDIKINTNSVQIFENFIIELQKLSSIDFMTNVQNKYKCFYNNIYRKTKEIDIKIFPSLQNIIATILDAGYYAVSLSNENKSSLDIITDYIDSILNEGKLCICIDNFSRCDMDTLSYFVQIIKKFIKNENFRACIVTVDEELSEDAEAEIQKNLPIVLPIMNIKGFDNKKYFFQIMDYIFEMNNITSDDISKIFSKCQGSPKQLSTMFGKLMEKDGIQFNKQGKAKINRQILESILKSTNIKHESRDFSSCQKWVIYSYLCLQEEESIETVENLALYVSKKIRLYCTYNREAFYNELQFLEHAHVLKCTSDNRITCYHDLDYFELTNIFSQDPLKGIFSQCAYEFILTHKNIPSYRSLLCRHAEEARVSGWIKLNYRYGKALFHNGQLYDAQKVFSKLENVLKQMHPMQILFIAITSYETGNFHLSIEQLLIINSEKLRYRNAKYFYYFYLGKSYNNIGRTDLAVINMKQALDKTKIDSSEYVQTLNILHMYYYEIPEKIKESEAIFLKIRDNYETMHPVIWANTMRGCQNFLSDEEALKVLENAELKLESELERAYLTTTKGFVLIKCNKNDNAKLCFSKASETIKRLKIHEYSYAANNLAVCYMMDKHYKEAKEILLEALLWNRTDYGELVLKVHLMICCLYSNLKNEALVYYNYLDKYMSKYPVDPIINRKVYINLAIASGLLGKEIAKKKQLSEAGKYIKGSTSEWRYHMLAKDSDLSIENLPTCLYQKITDFDPWFLIYAHD